MHHTSSPPSALFVVSNLQFRGAAKQVVEWATALAERDVLCRVCALGETAPWQVELEKQGVAVDVLRCRHWLDLSRKRRFDEVIRQRQPAVVHAWGMEALRTLALSRWTGRRVVTPCLRENDRRSWMRFVDRALLRKADHVLALGKWEATCCREWGVASENVSLMGPAIAVRPEPAAVTLPGLPEDAQVLLCVGRPEMHKGFQETIWAADILRYPYPKLHVVVIGEGPDRERLQSFARALSGSSVVHFVGEQADVLPWISRADVVCSTGRVDTGAQVVLEAMMVGRPVVAHRHPRLAELVRDGETGFLVTPGEKVELAKRAHQLLGNDSLRMEMGQAARRSVVERWEIGRWAEAWQRACLESEATSRSHSAVA